MIIILSLSVVGLGGYIIYDKVLSSDNEIVDNNNSNIPNNNETNIIENITKEEIKEIFNFVYNYYELPVVYCGETDNTIVQIYGTDRYVSKEFSSYDEMLNSLKKYMTIEVITGNSPWSATTKEYYLEQDGKLYCNVTYKGYVYSHGNIEIEVTLQEENKIECVATMELTDSSDNKRYDKVNITLEKNNDNWIIASYEEQN